MEKTRFTAEILEKIRFTPEILEKIQFTAEILEKIPFTAEILGTSLEIFEKRLDSQRKYLKRFDSQRKYWKNSIHRGNIAKYSIHSGNVLKDSIHKKLCWSNILFEFGFRCSVVDRHRFDIGKLQCQMCHNVQYFLQKIEIFWKLTYPCRYFSFYLLWLFNREPITQIKRVF